MIIGSPIFFKNTPGADITDYFNYGFTEETWRLYCEKQRRTKTDVATLNKIAVSTTPLPTVEPLFGSLQRWYRSLSSIVDTSLATILTDIVMISVSMSVFFCEIGFEEKSLFCKKKNATTF